MNDWYQDGTAQVERWVKAGLLAALLVLLLSAPARAHRPLFADGRGSDPGSALSVPNATVSYVLYAQLPQQAPVFWFALDVSRPVDVPLQLAVPDGVDWRELELVLALYPPGWKERLEEPGAAMPPPLPEHPAEAADDEPFIVRPRGDAQLFHEHVTGTKSWILAETQVTLSEPGTYYGVVYDAAGRGGKVWIAVGERERFTWRDLWRLPKLVRDVRRFHGLAGHPAWMWVAAGAFLAAPPAAGWLAGRGKGQR